MRRALLFTAFFSTTGCGAVESLVETVTYDLIEEVLSDWREIAGLDEDGAAESEPSPSADLTPTPSLNADPEAIAVMQRFLARKRAAEAPGGEDLWGQDREFETQLATDARSMSASKNMDAIAAAQERYRAEHGAYLLFERGDEATWSTLALALPQPEHHRYTTSLLEGALFIEARGNLDDDPFEDLWWGGPANGVSAQLSSDALDIDMYPLAVAE